MPTNKADIEKLVKYCYTEQGNMKYQIENSVTFELDTVNEVLKVMSKVFLYIGIVATAYEYSPLPSVHFKL